MQRAVPCLSPVSLLAPAFASLLRFGLGADGSRRCRRRARGRPSSEGGASAKNAPVWAVCCVWGLEGAWGALSRGPGDSRRSYRRTRGGADCVVRGRSVLRKEGFVLVASINAVAVVGGVSFLHCAPGGCFVRCCVNDDND